MKLKFSLFLFLIIISFTDLYSLDGLINPSKESGVFNTNIELSFDSPLDVDIYFYFNESLDKTPVRYQYPISLTAMSGEYRSYTLNVLAIDEDAILEEREFKYIIDKNLPLKAILNTKDGIYDHTLKLKFKENLDSIYYSINSDGSIEYNLWDGDIITITQKKELITDFIKSYTEDLAGNRTNVSVNEFTILPSENIINTINVLSPVEGNFLNSQLLYIDTTGFKWIRYSFNDVDPALRGTSYTSPVLLKTIGNFNLKIAALPLNSKEVLKKEVNFSIIANENVIINNNSGLYSEELNLKFNNNLMSYNLEDRKLELTDPFLPEIISIMPVPGVIKYRTIRIGNLNDPGEFRYLFVIDKKIPAAPIISVTPNQPVSSDTEVRLLGVTGADIYYTTDGSTPDRYSNFYKNPFIMKLPDGLNSGSMIIKAISYFNDKSSSQITTKLLTYDIKKPDLPEIEILFKNHSYVKFKISNTLGNRIVYTVSYNGQIPIDPVDTSFTGNEDMLLSLPYGIEQNVIIKVALIDKAGNISDPSIMTLLHSDTIPPGAPDIVYSEGTVTITGKDNIYYKIKSNFEVYENEFSLYTAPILLDIENEILNNFSVESFCIDKEGNKSNIKILKDIIIDKRIATFPQFSGLKNNGVYNKPLSLRFHSSDNINVYYSLSQGSNIPVDPVISETNIVNDFIYFDCPVNESRLYTVKLIAAYGEDTIPSSIVTLSFEIDRLAPRVPIISSIIDGKIYKDDVKILVNDSEELVWILIKEKIDESDLNYTYFQMNGILLNSEYTLRQSDNSEKNYQIAALSIDEAGNTSISREILNFTIDKIPPKVPVIIEDRSSQSNYYIRIISDTSDEIIYEIGMNGKQPELPDFSSNNYLLPIEINSLNETPIYISAKTIDLAGNLSKETAKYKFSFDTGNLISPLLSESKISSSIFSISFSTLTNSKIYLKYDNSDYFEYKNPLELDLRGKEYLDIFYYSIDSFENKTPVAVHRLEQTSSSGDLIKGVADSKIYNSGRVVWKANDLRTVRYEVAIDNIEPANVTVFSPELIDPIIFDSAPGETLTVSLNVKEFNDNTTIQKEYDTNYKFVIDKTKPSLPEIEGIEANGYYQTNLELNFKSNESVFYKISSDIDNLYPLDFTKYNSTVKISTDEGSYENLKVEAYSEDSAGNQSSIKVLKFVIDKANIYVSVKGNNGNNGSRLKPFKTIERALDYAEHSGRKTINLSEGEFLLDDTLNIENDVIITGAYTLSNWSVGRGETSISISKKFPVASPMFYVLSENVSINKLSLSNINLNSSFFNIKNGGLTLQNVNILHENIKNKISIELDNSNLIFSNSELIFGAIDQGKIINSNNSSIIFDNSIINGKGFSKNITIFNLTKSKLKLNDFNILPGVTQKLELIKADNSDIQINNSNLDTGLSSISTNMFLLHNTKLNMDNSIIDSISQSRILSCFNIKDSTISINNSIFNLNADTGISFAQLDNSSIELSNSSLTSKSTNEFSYFLTGNTSIINFNKNKIFLFSSDIIKGVELTNSVSIFHNNNFIFEGGTTVFNSFNFSSPLNIEFISNKIISNNLSWISSEDESMLNINGGKQNVSLLDNNFYGWKSVLNHNGNYVETTGELNSYRGFLDIPEGNYSKED